jgi:integrase
MRNPKFLALSRHCVYYFRWPLPKALHPESRSTTIKVSLRTRDPKRALFLARSLTVAAENLMTDGATDGMTLGEIRAVMKKHFTELLIARRERIAANGRLSMPELEALRNSAAIAHQDVAASSPLLPDDDETTLGQFVANYGLPVQLGTPAAVMLARELKRAHRDYCEAVMAYDRSLDTYDFTDEGPATVNVTREAPVALSMPLRELTDSYTADRLRGEAWVKKTEGERAEHIALLHEILGADTDVQKLGSAEAKQVKDTVLAYPKNRFKNQKTRELSLSDAVALPDVDRLNVKTVNKYFQTYSDLFRWAKRSGHIERNSFDGLTVRHSKKQADGRRDAFRIDQVHLMLRELLSSSSSVVKKDYQKWGPLIGVYTGARLNEIAQIHLSDVREQDGIWCFDLNDDDESKHLKNSASRRLVPIHQRLLELGLLEHAEKLRRGDALKLFPDFTYDPKNGWGRALGRWFNERFLPNLDLKSKELVFHSLRHTVVTHLSQAGVELPIVQSIVGHAREGVTQQHYFKQGYKLGQLSEALHKLPF